MGEEIKTLKAEGAVAVAVAGGVGCRLANKQESRHLFLSSCAASFTVLFYNIL